MKNLHLAVRMNEAPQYCPASPEEWRHWLQKHHESEKAVWLVYYKKGSGKPSLSWSEAVDEALCFGWIDSTKRSLDAERYMQYFTKRKAKSNWSKINKAKIELLTAQKKMTPAGMASVALAKENGSWDSST